MLRNTIAILLRDALINGLAASYWVPNRLRRFIYRVYGMHVGAVSIAPGCFFSGPHVSIGDGSFVNYGCFFACTHSPVEIGRDCVIAYNVKFCGGTHEIGPPTRRAGRFIGRKITVGDGCWIGAGAIILPGVAIGSGCVIAAGAVVTKDCAPNGLYAGVPARRIEELPV